MSKGTRKITGFLWAMLLAVLSFFVIFIFFQDVSEKAFGVSMDRQKIDRFIKNTTEKLAEDLFGPLDKGIKDKLSSLFTEYVAESLNSSSRSLSNLDTDGIENLIQETLENLKLENMNLEDLSIEDLDLENLNLEDPVTEGTDPDETAAGIPVSAPAE